jgi:hypothetical protein
MLSNKNRNKSFVFEEEFDQTQNKPTMKNYTKQNSRHDNNLIDSLEGIRQFKDKEKGHSVVSPVVIVIKVGGEEFQLNDSDSNGMIGSYLKDMNSIYDTKVNTLITRLLYFILFLE